MRFEWHAIVIDSCRFPLYLEERKNGIHTELTQPPAPYVWWALGWKPTQSWATNIKFNKTRILGILVSGSKKHEMPLHQEYWGSDACMITMRPASDPFQPGGLSTACPPISGGSNQVSKRFIKWWHVDVNGDEKWGGVTFTISWYCLAITSKWGSTPWYSRSRETWHGDHIPNLMLDDWK